ncbi:MAG: hypothetical protein K6T73_01105 [Candidatus Bathyarchaeota archaeon]|nr:hypothetical protein [Candidatus Bathyarchaeota archaeon]
MEIISLSLAAYAFSLSVQMARGDRFNFKPLNCRFCLSFWFSFFYFLITAQSINVATVFFSFVNGLSVAGICSFLILIDDRLLNPWNPWKMDKENG